MSGPLLYVLICLSCFQGPPVVRPPAVQETKNAPPVSKLDLQAKFSENREYDFGIISIKKEHVHEFKLKNPFESSLKIKSAVTSCGCAMAKLDRTTIEPGESATLRVTMDAIRFRGKKTATIQIRYVEPEYGEVQFSVKADIKNISVEPDELYFRRTEAAQMLVVRRAGSAHWKIKEVKCPDPFISAKVVDREVEERKVTYTIECQVVEKFRDQSFQTNVVLLTNDVDQPEISVPVYINLKQTVVAPRRLMFRQKSQQAQSKKFAIQTNTPCTIDAFKSNLEDLKIVRLSDGIRKVHIFEVSLPANSSIQKGARMTFSISTGEEAIIAIKAR